MPGLAGRQASALLGVDLNIAPSPTRHVSEVDSSPIQEGSRTPPRVRIKEPSRPRSYVQILEDFQANEDQISSSPSTSTSLASPPVMRGNSQQSRLSIVSTSDARTSSDPEMDNPNPSLVALSETDFATSEEFVAGSPSASSHIGDNKRVGSPLSSPPVTPKRKEDTVRRHKRFSMPAMALQTTPVTAKAIGEGKKRFSLVLGRDTVARTQRPRRQAPDSPEAHKKSLADGPAATKLNELLGRTKY
jgi:FYVE/RhoGEF/PH domain-containing protein 5/6